MILNFSEIKEEVEGLTIWDCPSADEGLWHRINRDGCAIRYSLDDPLYDIYLKKEMVNYPNAPFKVSARVSLYDVQGRFTMANTEIFEFKFYGEQPKTRMFLVNIPDYEKQIKECVADYSSIVQHEVEWKKEEGIL